MKYKVGDRVRIKSIDWYNRCTNGTKVHCGAYPFTSDMKEFCGQERIIANVCQECYVLLGIDDRFVWTDEMIEGLVEEETKPNIIKEAKTYWDSIKDAWICPDGYIFKDENGNVINTTKIVLEKKKKEYPKTYEECCKIMDCAVHPYITANEPGIVSYYEDDLNRGVLSLRKLLICRDAYWKIAGEEMGLGKPWKPNWAMYSGLKHCIIYSDNEIKWRCKSFVTEAKILAFPTKEMRDAFYENFKELIEQCKELL